MDVVVGEVEPDVAVVPGVLAVIMAYAPFVPWIVCANVPPTALPVPTKYSLALVHTHVPVWALAH